LDTLCVDEIIHMRKYALLKLTAMMERNVVNNVHSSLTTTARWSPNWAVHKLLRKINAKPGDAASSPSSKTRRQVFGVSLATVAQRTGLPLPQCILYVLYYLREQAPTCVGMFRKSGVRSR
jgi:hypothetical protein